MSDAVLVTGAFGLVGSATARRLAADGRRVIATDLDIPANRKAAAKLPSSVDVRYADLTDPAAVDALMAAVAPSAVIHLAAIIPPFAYMRRELAEKVNVGATASLLAAAAKQPSAPRFVLASSIAVYGPRNPHARHDLLNAETPVNPADLYGAHKAEAEKLVRATSLDWVILRLGGVLTVDAGSAMNLDNLYFEGLLPIDGRIQTVDVRDVARAFAAATTADAVGETLLIGGNDSHRLVQGDIAPAMAAAVGLVGGMPTGLRGNPDSADPWFSTDWMDTTRAQEMLGYQHHSWPDMLVEAADKAGLKRHLLRIAAPLTHEIFKRRAAYYGRTEPYADPWGAITAKWADPRPEGSTK
ncbi:MAG: oxidoreductase [Mycobacterium sp.]|nr:oxidoreductase [Mycobacterium sp.]